MKGSLPLYRLYSSSKFDHFYVTSNVEKNSALKSAGYGYEGLVGHVLTF